MLELMADREQRTNKQNG